MCVVANVRVKEVWFAVVLDVELGVHAEWNGCAVGKRLCPRGGGLPRYDDGCGRNDAQHFAQESFALVCFVTPFGVFGAKHGSKEERGEEVLWVFGDPQSNGVALVRRLVDLGEFGLPVGGVVEVKSREEHLCDFQDDLDTMLVVVQDRVGLWILVQPKDVHRMESDFQVPTQSKAQLNCCASSSRDFISEGCSSLEPFTNSVHLRLRLIQSDKVR